MDLDEVRHAWPKIAQYLKENKNFYHVYEEIIKMTPPNISLQQQSIFAVKTGTTKLVDNLENGPKKT